MASDVKTGSAGLGERDREILGELIAAYDANARFGWRPKMSGDGVWDGVAPIDCGGTDGSDHSYRLSKLCKLGLAEARKGASEWGKFSTRIKGSKKYRPTARGREVYAAMVAAAREAQGIETRSDETRDAAQPEG